jgi:hypothetical protein
MAKSPGDFADLPHIVTERVSRLEPFQITNKGLRLTLPLVPQADDDIFEGVIAVLTDCFMDDGQLQRSRIGIRILLFDREDNFYFRERDRSALRIVTDAMAERAQVKTIYLSTRDIISGRGGYN